LATFFILFERRELSARRIETQTKIYF